MYHESFNFLLQALTLNLQKQKRFIQNLQKLILAVAVSLEAVLRIRVLSDPDLLSKLDLIFVHS